MEDKSVKSECSPVHNEVIGPVQPTLAIKNIEDWLPFLTEFGRHLDLGTYLSTQTGNQVWGQSKDLDAILNTWKMYAQFGIPEQDQDYLVTWKQSVFGHLQYLSGFIDEGREFLTGYIAWQKNIISYGIKMIKHFDLEDLNANLKLIQDDIQKSKPKLPILRGDLCRMDLSFSIPTVVSNKRSASIDSPLKESHATSETDDRHFPRVDLPEDHKDFKERQDEQDHISLGQGLNKTVQVPARKDPSHLAPSIQTGLASAKAGEDAGILFKGEPEQQHSADGESNHPFSSSVSTVTKKTQSQDQDQTTEPRDFLNDAVSRFLSSTVIFANPDEATQKFEKLETSLKQYLEKFVLAGEHRNVVTDADLALLRLQIDIKRPVSLSDESQVLRQLYCRDGSEHEESWISVWLQKETQDSYNLYAKCKDHDYIWEDASGPFKPTTNFFVLGKNLVILNPEGKSWKVGYFSLNASQKSKSQKKKLCQLPLTAHFELKQGHYDTFNNEWGHLLISTGDKIVQLVLKEKHHGAEPLMQELKEFQESEISVAHSRLRVVHYVPNNLIIILCQSKAESKQMCLEVTVRGKENKTLHQNIGIPVDCLVDRMRCVVDEELHLVYVLLQKENEPCRIAAVRIFEPVDELKWHELAREVRFFDSTKFYSVVEPTSMHKKPT